MASADLRLLVVRRDFSERVQRLLDDVLPRLANSPAATLAGVVETDGVAGARDDVDLVIVVGGDGTILRTCRQLGAEQRPIIGVNVGRLGFLADLSPEVFLQQLPQILGRGYRVRHHLMFECTLLRADGSRHTHLGLNETAVLSAGSLQMLHIDLAIDGEHVTTYSGDGLIVSTPVGSTAHSLAAGGPILKQDLEAFVITPISPHTLTNRPLVDRADCLYALSLPEIHPGVTLVIDGQIKLPLLPGDRIELRRAPVTFQLARLPEHSYYSTLHRKLGWGGQPNYGRAAGS